MNTSTAKIGVRVVVIVDADAIVAQASPGDNLYDQATQIAGKLVALGALLLYPATAITEATTHIQRVLGSTVTAYGTAVVFTDPSVQVIEVNQETIKEAITYFSPITSKKNTLYDCIVAAIAKEKQADVIFSFNKFYKKLGFKLASDLL